VQEGLLPGTPAANVLTGLGLDEFFTRTDAAGLRALLPDALGSTLALADSTGAVQTEYTYEPFGATSISGAASANPFQYTGRENDGTDLYYYRARYYHSALGRFVGEDPIGFASGDVNLYAYVWNAPTMYADPPGLGGAFTLGGEAGLWVRPNHWWIRWPRPVKSRLPRAKPEEVPTEAGPRQPPSGDKLLDKSKHPAFREPMRFPRHLKPPNCLEGGSCTGAFPMGGPGITPTGGRKDPPAPPDTPPPCDTDMFGAYRCEA
jgi:RHS repeat-associated protein